MITSSTKPSFRLRSFVGRNSRITAAQANAFGSLFSKYGLLTTDGLLNGNHVFGRVAPQFLEIGFGMGHSLLALANAYPDNDFIGVETHRPGVGALLLGIEMQQLTNLRVYNGDVVDIVEKNIAPASLQGIQIFFPDPWQKRRHNERRLIQADFVSVALQRLKIGGELHLATDWEDYATHMLKVLSQEDRLLNKAETGSFTSRSPYRPIQTKFERRAIREGRSVWELQFIRQR